MEADRKIMVMNELYRTKMIILETVKMSRARSLMIQKIDECALWLGSIPLKRNGGSGRELVDTCYEDYYRRGD
jgi:hypothetical protein